MFLIEIRRWLDSNRRPLEVEVTALPTEPPPLPIKCHFIAPENIVEKIKEQIMSKLRKASKAK